MSASPEPRLPDGHDSAHSLHRMVRHPDVMVYVHIEYHQGEGVTMLRGWYPNGDLTEPAAFMSECVDTIEDKFGPARNSAKAEGADPEPNETEKKWRDFRDSLPTPKTEDA